MALSRILIVVVCGALSAGTLAAQSKPAFPFASVPPPGSSFTPNDLRIPPASSALLPGSGSLSAGSGLRVPPLSSKSSLRFSFPLSLASGRKVARARVWEVKDSRCYAMRSYRFSRDDSQSDTTRLEGSSTCLSAANVHTKAANSKDWR